ncbi:MAG: cation:proton antiporter, partial [Candidatus Hermodarchaeota archaeon]|nr:cation:proton antiporter [Candidatus Hermodarchaeota archaeon]
MDFHTFGLLLVGSIILIAWISELFARITRIPNIVFHLFFAMIISPFVIIFGYPILNIELIKLIIGLSIAIVAFEAGYNFNRCLFTIESQIRGQRGMVCQPLSIRQVFKRIIRLSGVAGIITTVLMTLVFIYLVGFPPTLAALTGVLCGITGSTVITPILSGLSIKRDVAEALRDEGDFNDAIFPVVSTAILTVFSIQVVELITNLPIILLLIVTDVAIGILIGIAIGGVGILLVKTSRPWMKRYFRQRFSPTVVVTLDMLGLLCAAILAYSFGELLGIEGALVATLTAGILLGHRHRLEKEKPLLKNAEGEEFLEAEIHTFQLPLTHIAVVTIFIISISFSLPFLLTVISQVSLIILALIVVCLLMFVVRPIAVFVATIHSAFSVRERLFMSFLAPRGVIISALALFVAFEIASPPLSSPEYAALVLWFTLVIVFVTILVEGGLAPWTAKKTGMTEP